MLAPCGCTSRHAVAARGCRTRLPRRAGAAEGRSLGGQAGGRKAGRASGRVRRQKCEVADLQANPVAEGGRERKARQVLDL